ncbi:MAG: NPCBM/NEW2 domain-containing protein [Pirellulaceae bacterium]
MSIANGGLLPHQSRINPPTLFALFVLALPVAAQSPIHLADRIVAKSELQSLHATNLVFRSVADPMAIEVPRENLVRWGTWPGVVKQRAAWLADGSWLAGEMHFNASGKLEIDNDWIQTPAIDLPMLRGLVLTPPASLRRWSELQQQMAAADGTQDIVWLNSRQRISGVVRWPTNSDGTEIQHLNLETSNQTTEIDIDDVQAIVFSPTLLGPMKPHTHSMLGLVDGSLLRVAEVTIADSRVRLRLSGLDLISYESAAEFCQAIAYLSDQPKRNTFLQDLQPASYRNLTETKLQWELGIGQDVSGQALRSEAGLLFNGLAMHSASQVAYRWDGSPGQFLAEATLAPLDRLSAPLGSVQCQILLAREGALQKISEFELTRQSGAQQSQLVDVEIAGAQLIVLLVEEADFGQYGDQVFWLEARCCSK